MKKHNFSAGPCILTQEVLQKASEAVINFNGTGLSILGISHRSEEFVAVMEKARNLAKELLELPDTYSILFLQGGASLEFLRTAYNLLTINGKAGYIDTGRWSAKALHEAQLLGKVEIIASSKDQLYNYIPTSYTIPKDIDYLHITSNNTIYGTQFKQFPQTEVPLVCDMSSDIFSRKIDFTQFDVIYAGAQKNIGPSGATLVAINNDILGKTGRTIPSLLNYQTLIEHQSMFNTPAVFPVYVCMLTLEWLKNLGGIEHIEKINQKKAAILYDEIDNNPLFHGTAQKKDRSLMNVTFQLSAEANQNLFDQLCHESGICNIKGHRTAGGYRASIYNAMPIESVKVLQEVMCEFKRIS